MSDKYTWSAVAVAGTFDRLHRGHRYFISKAFEYGEKVIIGLTSDEYVGKKLKTQISKVKTKIGSYKERKKELEIFLNEKEFINRSRIVKIDDVYGPAIKNTHIEALVVTSETIKGARKVNNKRWEKNLKPLKIITVPFMYSSDHKRIASTRIRLGEIDRWGHLLAATRIHTKEIAEKLRFQLKKPIGLLIAGNPETAPRFFDRVEKSMSQLNPSMVITVGDVCSKLFNTHKKRIDLAIVDFLVERKRVYYNLSDVGFGSLNLYWVVSVNNPPGRVRKSLISAVARAMHAYFSSGTRTIIKVVGEEDLAGIPAILLAPLGAVVCYGQPGKGIVLVEVTEDRKRMIVDLVEKYG